MTTKQIISILVGNFKDLKEKFLSFEEFKKLLENKKIPEEVKNFFPLRDPVLKLIYKEIYSIMPFDREYILGNYQKEYKGKYYLFYPAQKYKRLIILFSGFINRISYNRYSWYWDETETWNRDTAYLFLNDITTHWYVGARGEHDFSIYSSIINNIIDNTRIDKNHCFCVGASMGGYASILYSIKLSLGGCISVHPQLSFKSTQRYVKHRVWANRIYECGEQFIDIDDVIGSSSDINTKIYLEIGDNLADQYGLDKVLYELSKKHVFFIINRINYLEHETESPSRKKIEHLIDFFEKDL